MFNPSFVPPALGLVCPRLSRTTPAIALLALLSGCNLFSAGDRCLSLGEEIPGTRVFVPMGESVPYWSYDVRVSPDGRFLAFSNRGALTLHNLTTGEQTAIASGRSPSWSPDGNWIAFVSGVQIFKVKTDGDSLKQLTDQGLNFFPAWSPDGKMIAYDRSVADEAGPGGIWWMSTDGSEKTSLFGGASPSWHPDGTKIAAQIAGGFVIFDLSSKRVIRQLEAFPGDQNRNPQYSPDGNAILFHTHEGAWILNQQGGKPRAIATTCRRDGLGRRIDASTWHPDGKHVIIQQLKITDGKEDYEGPKYEGYSSFRKVAVPASFWR